MPAVKVFGTDIGVTSAMNLSQPPWRPGEGPKLLGQPHPWSAGQHRADFASFRRELSRPAPLHASRLVPVLAQEPAWSRSQRTARIITVPKRASDGGLLVAVEHGEVIGYALFGLPKRSPHVRLAHLCVAGEHCGNGVTRLLVEEIRRRHRDRLGIKAKCRRDYGISDMWTSLGFGSARGSAGARTRRGDPGRLVAGP
ncbi:GNAT family N-acetyltransferase [Streptomyces sp. NPDC059788]|uniref:GNAT family N-acetyltransferase n=1 Tax=Streptomyces sp. NPDC059788 TaxID=3346948 RepID=UPI003663FCEF